ncbi:MAG: hypothetical protein GXO83_00165 [Chlorobi bacterium]|nr:hypothetical protein [Chlorobiota bacterium]
MKAKCLPVLFMGWALSVQIFGMDIPTVLPGRIPQQDTLSYRKGVLNKTARLFSDKDNTSSVVLYIPADSTVEILGSEDAYFLVRFKNIEGYIFQRKVKGFEDIRNSFFAPPPATEEQIEQNSDRISSFINKYGPERGRKIAQHKIWRGMTREMVMDSWGKPRAINIYGTRMTRREEWEYNRYVLIFENGILARWR